MTTPTPFDDLAARMAEIRARVAAATPGPWQEFCESGDWWVEQTDGAYNGTGRTVGESPDLWSCAGRHRRSSGRCRRPSCRRGCEGGSYHRKSTMIGRLTSLNISV